MGNRWWKDEGSLSQNTNGIVTNTNTKYTKEQNKPNNSVTNRKSNMYIHPSYRSRDQQQNIPLHLSHRYTSEGIKIRGFL